MTASSRKISKRPGRDESPAPVSYTHLDVYKRQVIECLRSPNYNLKKKDTPNVYFAGNGLSSEALEEILDLVRDVDFSVNVISKSGTTTEPAAAFRFFRQLLVEKYGREGARERIFAKMCIRDRPRGAWRRSSWPRTRIPRARPRPCTSPGS